MKIFSRFRNVWVKLTMGNEISLWIFLWKCKFLHDHHPRHLLKRLNDQALCRFQARNRRVSLYRSRNDSVCTNAHSVVMSVNGMGLGCVCRSINPLNKCTCVCIHLCCAVNPWCSGDTMWSCTVCYAASIIRSCD